MLVIGLTGGIGSGKTTVAKIFQSFGVPVYNSDVEAKKILFSSIAVHHELELAFGKSVFTEGLPDKVKLAQIVFSDKEKLKQLNAIIHPKVAADFETWKLNQNSYLVVKEAAILIESGAYKSVDKIVVVSAPIDVRVERVMKRDSSQKEDVLKRIQNQLSEEERLSFADFEIKNNNVNSLILQVKKLLLELN